MKFDLPVSYEFILNRYISDEKKDYGKPYYEFECWEFGTPADRIVYFKEKTAAAIAKKITNFIKVGKKS